MVKMLCDPLVNIAWNKLNTLKSKRKFLFSTCQMLLFYSIFFIETQNTTVIGKSQLLSTNKNTHDKDQLGEFQLSRSHKNTNPFLHMILFALVRFRAKSKFSDFRI